MTNTSGDPVLDGIPILQPSLGAIVAVFVFAILTGRLVPRRTMDDALHDRDEWKAAHRISETARQAGQDQVSELLEHARTTDALIRAIQAQGPHARLPPPAPTGERP